MSRSTGVDLASTMAVAGTHPDRAARAARRDKPVKSETLEMRQAVVTKVDVAGGLLECRVGGDDQDIPTVPHMSNYRAKVGDTVQVLLQGYDMYVLDRISNLGPSVISDAQSYTVVDDDTTTSVLWTELFDGPSLANISVSPSGRLLMHVSALAWGMAGGEGALMSVMLQHMDEESFIVYPSLPAAQIVYSATANEAVAASKVLLYNNLPAGPYLAKAMYTCLHGNGATFSNRHMWALPL